MFNNDNDNIGKLFYDVLEDFDENLPNRVWDNVNSELKKGKKRKRVIVYISIAASVALIIAFSSGYFMALNNSKHQQFSNSDIHKELNNKPLAIKEKPKTNLLNDDTTKINTITKSTYKNIKNNSFPQIISKINNTVALGQNNNDRRKDTNNVVNDSIIQNKLIVIAKSNIEKQTKDTINVRKPVPDFRQDLIKDFNNQADINNKNQNIVKNNMPFEKKKEQENTSGQWSLAEQFSPVGYFGSGQKALSADAATYSAANQSGNEPINDKRLLIVYATGLSFKYQMNKKWGVKSGLFYATGELATGQQHKQMEIPVMADYTLINKKFKWELNGGLGANFLFSQGEKNINYSGLLGTTLGYNISPRISVNIEPTLKYNFSYPSNYIFHYYPYSFAVYTGLSYNF